MRTRLQLLFLTAFAVVTTSFCGAAESLARREWAVNGVTREALLAIPAGAKSTATPVVFEFHGHGGGMRNAAQSFHGETLWPQAIIVYMQGLNTPGRLTDPNGEKAGWQNAPGHMEDRDLKFFDAVLASLKSDYKVDEKRIYATGHSNGGGFTYLLWATRGKTFAAVAPSAALASPGFIGQLEPKPVLHFAGRNDPLVKFAWQEMTINFVRKLNQCGEGKPWPEDPTKGTMYESKSGTPVISWIHDGGHGYLPEEPALIVKFFQQHVKP